MLLRGNGEIQALGVRGEEIFLKVSLEIFQSYGLKDLERVLLPGEFVVVLFECWPHVFEVPGEIDSFLSNLCVDRFFLGVKVLLCNILDLISQSEQENVDSVHEVFSTLARRLNEELVVSNSSNFICSIEDNISELLFGSEIIEEGLVKVLHNDFVNQFCFEVDLPYLIV